MNPQRRLKEIEQSKGCPECNGGCDIADKLWLVERIKKLSEPLEVMLHTHFDLEEDFEDLKAMVKKALRDE